MFVGVVKVQRRDCIELLVLQLKCCIELSSCISLTYFQYKVILYCNLPPLRFTKCFYTLESNLISIKNTFATLDRAKHTLSTKSKWTLWTKKGTPITRDKKCTIVWHINHHHPLLLRYINNVILDDQHEGSGDSMNVEQLEFRCLYEDSKKEENEVNRVE